MYPIFFEFHGIKFHSYGLMIVAGFALGMWWSVKECRKHGLPPETGLDVATYCLILGLVVSRIVYVLLNWRDYAGNPFSAFLLQKGGLSFHGALLGGIIAAWLYARVKKIDFLLLVDVLSPCVVLGYPVARLGCFLNGCCYGTPTHLPWGCVFPDANHPGQLTPPSHPAQIYSSLSVFIMFLVFVRLDPYFRARGQKFAALFTIFGIDRFFMEFFRRGVTAQITPVFGLTQAQLVSLAMIILSLILFKLFQRKGEPPSEDEAQTDRSGTADGRTEQR